jgi:Zn-finger nucleic acid-binding protein
MNERSAYRCPDCGEALFVGRAKNVVLHACGRCRGIWLDKDDALRAGQGWISEEGRSLASAVDASPGKAAGYRTAAAGIDEHGKRGCPHCARALTRRSGGAVELDVCMPHGVWFDRGELVRFADAALQARAGSGASGDQGLRVIALFAALEGEIDLLRTHDDPIAKERAARLDLIVRELRALSTG